MRSGQKWGTFKYKYDLNHVHMYHVRTLFILFANTARSIKRDSNSMDIKSPSQGGIPLKSIAPHTLMDVPLHI